MNLLFFREIFFIGVQLGLKCTAGDPSRACAANGHKQERISVYMYIYTPTDLAPWGYKETVHALGVGCLVEHLPILQYNTYIYCVIYIIQCTVTTHQNSTIQKVREQLFILWYTVLYCSIYEMWGGSLFFSIDDMNKIYIFVLKMVIIDIKFPYLFRDLKFPESFFL